MFNSQEKCQSNPLKDHLEQNAVRQPSLREWNQISKSLKRLLKQYQQKHTFRHVIRLFLDLLG